MDRDDEKLLNRRFKELAESSETQNRFTFTDFLGLAEQDVFHRSAAQFPHVPYMLFGGHSSCERQMVRFGSPDNLGYSEAFPIECLRISAAAPKFAEKLTHRDYLGSVLGLGIERRVIGDIFIDNGSAFVFCEASIADFLCDELSYVKHTAVKVTRAGELPESALPRLESCSVQVSSERLDAVIASAFHLSRGKSQELFKAGRVFLDGRLCESSSKTPAPGSIVSLRGHGRFIYDGVTGTTKKGRLTVSIRTYNDIDDTRVN